MSFRKVINMMVEVGSWFGEFDGFRVRVRVRNGNEEVVGLPRLGLAGGWDLGYGFGEMVGFPSPIS